MIRNPSVAGRFYEASPDALRKQVDTFIVKDAKKEKALGVISPHAGFLYSGQVAGAVYSRIEVAKTFIILGPNHTGMGESGSIMCEGEWHMPNGLLSIDSELAGDILSSSAVLKEDEAGHLNEHSIEVQLPFIQYFSTDFTIVPITMISMDFETCENIGNAIAKAVKDKKKEITIIASTDMTHYESHLSASKKDKEAIQYMTALDPEGLFTYIKNNNISMCGFASATSALVACNNLNASSATLVKYMTSGEISGDYESVVGYAGMIIK